MTPRNKQKALTLILFVIIMTGNIGGIIWALNW